MTNTFSTGHEEPMRVEQTNIWCRCGRPFAVCMDSSNPCQYPNPTQSAREPRKAIRG